VVELLTRYELEPQLRDVFVEGTSDQALLDWFLKRAGLRHAQAYEVSSVDVPPALLGALGLDNNNRGRVMALAHQLHASSPQDLQRRVVCIADSDFHHILRESFSCPLLLFTDYTSIEVYCLEEKVLTKFLNLIVGGFPASASELIDALMPALQELFLIRVADRTLGLRLEVLPAGRCCSIGNARVVLDVEDYVTRLLNKGNQRGQRRRFLERLQELRGDLTSAPRHYIHGHDFISLLVWYIAKTKKSRRFYDPDLLSRSIIACLEYEWISTERLFAEILQRLS